MDVAHRQPIPGDGQLIAELRGQLQPTYVELGRHRDALSHLQVGLELATELGDQLTIARDRLSMGDVHIGLGEPSAAQAQWQEALRIFLELGHPEAQDAQCRLRQHDA